MVTTGTPCMETDKSEGWEGVANEFVAARSTIGTALIRSWARQNVLRRGSVLDVGCGSGVPVAAALIDQGLDVFGIDASPTLIAAFRRRFPTAHAACEPAQESAFFHRSFDAAVAIGLLFLLPPADQRHLLGRIAGKLRPGGRLLFTAPRQRCVWNDILTGRLSCSLGQDAYARALDEAGLMLVGCLTDEGENNYYDAVKPTD